MPTVALIRREADGSLDKQGTGVPSFSDKHKLIWNHQKHNWTVNTASSNLPECIFNTGYLNFVLYAINISSRYDDLISWVFIFETNVTEVSQGDLLDMCIEETMSFLEEMIFFN